jgi:hypothetical protein
MTERYARITKVRSLMLAGGSESLKSSGENRDLFALEIIGLLPPGQFLVEEMEPFTLSDVDSEHAAYLFERKQKERLTALRNFYFFVKPICNKEFCMRSLAMARDLGVDFDTPEIRFNLRMKYEVPMTMAVMMSLSRRVGAGSAIKQLGSDILEFIVMMAFG